MSRENVELMRWLIDAWNRRDLDGFVSKLHDDVEWVPALIAQAEAGSEAEFHGIDGFWRWVRAMEDVMPEYQVLADAYHDIDGDRVLVLGTVVGRGRASGAEVRADLGQVFTFRDGEVVSYRGYLDQAEAMAAVGLRE